MIVLYWPKPMSFGTKKARPFLIMYVTDERNLSRRYARDWSCGSSHARCALRRASRVRVSLFIDFASSAHAAAACLLLAPEARFDVTKYAIGRESVRPGRPFTPVGWRP